MFNRRSHFRQGLSTLYLPYYDALCTELPEHWQPYDGLRTVNEQDAMFAQGRSRPGERVTNARGGQSAHNYGCATDWTLFQGGVPTWPDPEDKVWAEYHQVCEKVGVKWGAGATLIDCPHNELVVACAWPVIYHILKTSGMKAAQEHIEKNVRK